MRKTTTLILWALIGIGSLAGFYGARKRYEAEALNRRVELCLDYAELRMLAEMTSTPMPGLLQRLKAAGVTSVAVTEDTLAGLESIGTVRPADRADGRALFAAPGPVLSRVRRELAARGLRVAPPVDGDTGPVTGFVPVGPESSSVGRIVPVFVVPGDYATIRGLGLGLDPNAVKTVHRAGLGVVGRIGNFAGVSPTSAAAVLKDLAVQGVKTVIFQGTDVLGFRGMFLETADAFRATGLNYGQIEFGKQRGDERLSVALKGEYVRVHSIGDAEMGTLDENEIIDRFVRAARERNIRLCYIRLPFTAGIDPVGRNVELLKKIEKGIAREGEMTFGMAHAFPETGVPKWLFAAMALGVAAGTTLLAARIVPLSGGPTVLLAAALALLCAGLAGGAGEMGRKLVALLAGIAFPTLACLRKDILSASPAIAPARGDGAGATTGRVGRGQAAGRAIQALATASGITSLGILQVVGLLATLPFMVKANQFLGIKAQHAVPILIIGLVAIVGLPAVDRPWVQEWDRIKARAAAFVSEPTRVGTLLLALVAVAALALVVARTGNDPGVGVSGMELEFRSLLDRFLPVRPRTKEFLIGHPAWILALAIWYRGRRRWAVPLFVVGVLGQVSLLNTFCHIHTPVMLSLIRDFTGLVLGAFIGLALFWVLDCALPEPKQAAYKPEPPCPAPLQTADGEIGSGMTQSATTPRRVPTNVGGLGGPPASRAPIRITLSGYYGCGNTGDEAVLAGILESFRRRAGEDSARFTVLSADPDDTTRRHGLGAVPRMRLAAVRRALRDCDLLVSGGGSLLQDITSLRSLIYYVGVVWLARLMRRPVMLYAQGIGPLRRPIARRLARSAAEQAQQITVRDAGSAALLKEMGVRRPAIEVTADPAFALTPVASERAATIRAQAGVPTGIPVVGISLRPWDRGGPSIEEYACMVRQVAKLAGAHVLFLPMQPPGDLVLAEDVARATGVASSIVRSQLSPQEAVGVIGQVDGLLALRLHSLIFGAMGGVPLAAIAYDPKVASLMGRLGQAGRCVPVAGSSADAAAHALADSMAEGGVLRDSLRRRAAELADLALVNVDRAIAAAGASV